MADLAELLRVLDETASKHKLHKPYICGGVVRDLVFARNGGAELGEINDLDITTGFGDVGLLADLFAGAVGKSTKEFSDGHKQVFVDGVYFDFSTNFRYPGIDALLERAGVEQVDDLVRETFSRDFTMNALLMPLDFSGVVDLTGKGEDDIRARVLRCPLDCDVSFKASPNRIMRALVYIAKLDLKMSEGLKQSLLANLDLLKRIHPRYAGEKLNEALRLKPELLDELIELGILAKLPLTKHVSRMLIKQRRLKDVL